MGDCWLVGAMVALAAEHCAALDACRFQSSDRAAEDEASVRVEHDAVCVRLFWDGAWTEERMAAVIPDPASHARACGDHGGSGALWPAFVELALARKLGGKGCLEGGNSALGLRALSGGMCETLSLTADAPVTTSAAQGLRMSGEESAERQRLRKRADRLWARVNVAGDAPRTAACLTHACQGDGGVHRESGILTNHTYAVVAKAEPKPGMRILWLRDPGGAGPSAGWVLKRSQDLSRGLMAPPPGPDHGVFCLSVEEVCLAFTKATVCMLPPRSRPWHCLALEGTFAGSATTAAGQPAVDELTGRRLLSDCPQFSLRIVPGLRAKAQGAPAPICLVGLSPLDAASVEVGIVAARLTSPTPGRQPPRGRPMGPQRTFLWTTDDGLEPVTASPHARVGQEATARLRLPPTGGAATLVLWQRPARGIPRPGRYILRAWADRPVVLEALPRPQRLQAAAASAVQAVAHIPKWPLSAAWPLRPTANDITIEVRAWSSTKSASRAPISLRVVALGGGAGGAPQEASSSASTSDSEADSDGGTRREPRAGHGRDPVALVAKAAHSVRAAVAIRRAGARPSAQRRPAPPPPTAELLCGDVWRSPPASVHACLAPGQGPTSVVDTAASARATIPMGTGHGADDEVEVGAAMLLPGAHGGWQLAQATGRTEAMLRLRARKGEALLIAAAALDPEVETDVCIEAACATGGLRLTSLPPVHRAAVAVHLPGGAALLEVAAAADGQAEVEVGLLLRGLGAARDPLAAMLGIRLYRRHADGDQACPSPRGQADFESGPCLGDTLETTAILAAPGTYAVEAFTMEPGARERCSLTATSVARLALSTEDATTRPGRST